MKLPILKSFELVQILEQSGCILKRQTGSHRIFYFPKKRRIIVIPIHTKDIKKGLLRAIIRDLDMSVKEFVELRKQQ